MLMEGMRKRTGLLGKGTSLYCERGGHSVRLANQKRPQPRGKLRPPLRNQATDAGGGPAYSRGGCSSLLIRPVPNLGSLFQVQICVPSLSPILTASTPLRKSTTISFLPTPTPP